MKSTLLHHLPLAAAERQPDQMALTCGASSISYRALAEQMSACASGLKRMGVARGDRVAVYLEKRTENVVAMFGAAAAGAAFVPLNPLLKPRQIGHALVDSAATVLVTSSPRLTLLEPILRSCPSVRHVVLVDDGGLAKRQPSHQVHAWTDLLNTSLGPSLDVTDADMAAIFYTSGSTGLPKGVMLSHRNLVMGAICVASYLQNNSDDVLLGVLPLAFDAGFSQLTTAFHVGARVVLLDYLFPKDVLSTMTQEGITGITAVPPLYIQLVKSDWPAGISDHLRYFASTGGRMPRDTLNRLRMLLPRSKPFLMYGLTEAFRATYLPPEEIDRRPGSIGRAIPGAEVLVLREDGSPCAVNEPGELVQRGPLVSMGYWNDPVKTAERFRPLPARAAECASDVAIAERAVFSGDTVRVDDSGYLYFIGRRDDMIKTSGYRVSPTEVEEVLYGTGRIAEAAAFGKPHPALGEAIVVVVTRNDGDAISADEILSACRAELPAYMVPTSIEFRAEPLPRNINGKIDRAALRREYDPDVPEPA